MSNRAIRLTLYDTHDDPAPVTSVVTEDDITVSLEELIEDSKYKTSTGFVAHQVLPVRPGERGSSPSLVQRMLKHQQKRDEQERHQAMLYYWDAAQFARLNPGGVLSATKPAPLSIEEITDVLKQLYARADYDGFTIIVLSDDMTLLRLNADGSIDVEEVP